MQLNSLIDELMDSSIDPSISASIHESIQESIHESFPESIHFQITVTLPETFYNPVIGILIHRHLSYQKTRVCTKQVKTAKYEDL